MWDERKGKEISLEKENIYIGGGRTSNMRLLVRECARDLTTQLVFLSLSKYLYQNWFSVGKLLIQNTEFRESTTRRRGKLLAIMPSPAKRKEGTKKKKKSVACCLLCI